MNEPAKQNVPELRFHEFHMYWHQLCIGDLGNIITGTTPDPNKLENYNGTFPFFTPADVPESGGKIYKTAKMLTETGLQSVRKIPKGATLFVCIGSTIGKVGQTTEKGASNQQINAVAVNKDNDASFVHFLLIRAAAQIQKLTAVQAVPIINKTTFSAVKIFAPSIPEQQKIASFLSAVDEKIAQLQEKKTLLDAYKKGCMQKLFSQTLRFKDDNGNDYPDWEETTIGKIGKFYYGKSAPKFSLAPDAPTLCVRYGELYSKYGIVIHEAVSRTTIEPSNLRFSKGDEILVPRVGEDPLDFATYCCLLVPADIAIGEMISVFNTNENSLFYTYYFRTYRKQFARMVEGGNVSNLYYSYLEDIEIGKPHPEEQQKIADFLSAIDDKITHATAQLEHAKTFKKGLLQKMFV